MCKFGFQNYLVGFRPPISTDFRKLHQEAIALQNQCQHFSPLEPVQSHRKHITTRIF